MIILNETAPANLRDVSRLRREAARRLCELRMAPDLCDAVLLALSEALANVVLHARPAAGFLGLRIALEGATLRVDMRDDGGAFAEAERRIAAARSRPCAPERESGRGLALIAQAFSRIEYEAGAENRLTGIAPLGRSVPCVLVAEDDPTLLDLYAHHLRGWRVAKARSLREALLALETLDVCAIVADLHLGDGLGSSLIAALERDPARTEPLVLISAAPLAACRAACPAAEAFLPKPVAAQALRAAVEGALARSALRAARHARAFARTLEGLFAGGAPSFANGHDLALARCSAGVGGGDLLVTQKMEDRLRLTLMDVMGHGVAAKGWAAAFAGMCVGLSRAPPGEANDHLLALAEITWREPALERVIATALVVDVMASGDLRLASAGHPAPVVIGAQGARRVEVQGPVLGVAPPQAFALACLRLKAGERLVTFTDGVDSGEAAAGGPAPDWLVAACAAQDLFSAREEPARTARARLGAAPADDWTILVLGSGGDQA
jgi:sigma-B regulation protein RsbU (phosphoserine phosphatase)